MTLKIVTWNIHGFVGADGIADPDRAADVLKSIEPDVVGLQEVDTRRPPSRTDPLEQLAERVRLRAVFGPTRFEHGGYFGNALLTRFDVVEVFTFDVSVKDREPRGVLEVHLCAAGRKLRVLVTHFGLRAAERREQVDWLLERVKAAGEDPVVLMGDFNEWHPRAISLTRIHLAMGWAPAVRSYPARFPLLKLDRIWVHRPQLLANVTACRMPGVARVSDHLPVQAVVELPS